jgi:hypothetical protein
VSEEFAPANNPAKEPNILANKFNDESRSYLRG